MEQTQEAREKLVFTKFGHLGRSNHPDDHDQRLARDQHGYWYLYDWSGDDPQYTEDGPLRVDLKLPIEVDREGCIVSVIDLGRQPTEPSDQRYRVHVTHEGMVKMLKILGEHDSDNLPMLTIKLGREFEAMAHLAGYAKQHERRAQVAYLIETREPNT